MKTRFGWNAKLAIILGIGLTVTFDGDASFAKSKDSSKNKRSSASTSDSMDPMGPSFQYQAVDPNVKLSDEGLLQDPAEDSYYPPAKKSGLPAVQIRDSAFKEAGLTDDVSKMDDLERDLLYLRAKKWELREVTKKYPSLPESKLVRLNQWIRNQRE